MLLLVKRHFGSPARILAILGIGAITLILFAVAALTFINLRQTSNRINSISSAAALGDAYNRMLVSVAEAVGYSAQFSASGDPQDGALTLQSIQAAFVAESEIKTLGNNEDRALMTSLEVRYGAQLAQAQQILVNPSLLGTEGISGDPFALNEVAAIIAPPTLEKRQQAALQLATLEREFQSRTDAILIAFAVSVPLLGMLVYLIVRYERKDAVRVEEMKKLGQAALTDSLTGLGNHRAFQDDLRRELARASRTAQPLSVAMMDIDEFKVVNDSYGHARGDEVLSEIGNLMSFVRGEDRSYRVGGDEFALIMPNTDAKSASQALNRLRQTIDDTIEGVTVSLGVSSSLAGTLSAPRLQEHADQALYEAKHRGKNQVVSFDMALAQGNELTAGKMNALLEVLKSGKVTMLFQPIFRTTSQHEMPDDGLVGFEALLRLPQAQQLSGPEEAFDIAQHMGRSRDLDLLCTGSALEAARELAGDVKIFINLDPATLMHSDFSPEELLTMVTERGLDPAKVVFEITEKTTVPLWRLATQVGAMQRSGFKIALDDVGSGNSGLEMMRVMKFDFVKIDRSVILDAAKGGPGRAIILAIVAFASEAGAFIIAEGIENQAMLESIKFDQAGLSRFWIQGVQGFMFGKPRISMTSLESDVLPAA